MFVLRPFVSLVLLLALCASTFAGGGPENVLLVVNANSQSSLTIANHYVATRQIPENNVLYIDWQSSTGAISIGEFREKLLQPILETIEARGLTPHIDYIVYSSDFPWRINIADDFPGVKFPKQAAAAASLTGATYLWRHVLAKDPQIISLGSNRYFQKPDSGRTKSFGFRGWYGWAPGGERMETGGESYFLSTMLGVTTDAANSVDEVLDYLRRSYQANGVSPRGTIYYVQNDNIRSKVRQGMFDDAVAELNALGVRAEVLRGTLPLNKNDVQGAMIGTAKFDWKKSGSRIASGAICDHLTSFGGMMSGKGQTLLSEFLRYGAAGASGTIVEPFAIAAKFPHATIHVHYARGCSLAEAFYQSVAGPYQLLIVGDPLCQPWAMIPEVQVDGLTRDETVSGRVKFVPSAKVPTGQSIDHFEIYLDGRRLGRIHPGDDVQFDTAALPDGYHELRVVAVAAGPIQTQGQKVIPFVTDNHGGKIDFRVAPEKTVPAGSDFRVGAIAPGAESFVVLHNGRIVARFSGERGQKDIPTEQFGKGPVTLRAVTIGENEVRSKPITVYFE